MHGEGLGWVDRSSGRSVDVIVGASGGSVRCGATQ